MSTLFGSKLAPLVVSRARIGFVFERFTKKAIKTIMQAQQETRRLGHNFVGTEQILLGLLVEGTGIAATTLKSAGFTLHETRTEVEKIIGRGSGFVAVEIPFTTPAKRLLELSWDESRQLKHDYIGASHLLLALLRDEDGVAGRMLTDHSIVRETLRKSILEEIMRTANAD
jgi:ATP-dependent Clp protease ATP-binding subunit ClpC